MSKLKQYSLLLRGLLNTYLHTYSLRTFLVGSMLFVLMPILLMGSWHSYLALYAATESYTQSIGIEFSERIKDRVTAFFRAPERLVAYNVGQIRMGYMKVDHPDELMRQFLLQIEQYPQLTFITFGKADGQYFSGSRTPRSHDKQLRILEAKISNNRAMEVFEVDANLRKSKKISHSDIHYDVRWRPWYKATTEAGKAIWYGPYQYLIKDTQGIYTAIGLAFSAPAYDTQAQFVGVIGADLALSQISDFLKEVVTEFGGLAFMTDAKGQLLASSNKEFITPKNTENLDQGWLQIQNSSNSLLKAAGQMIIKRNSHDGNAFLEQDSNKHLVRWWTHSLSNGPDLTMGVVLPVNKFDASLNKVLNNLLYLVLTLIIAAILLAFFIAHRVAHSLVTLSDQANRITNGELGQNQVQNSHIREVISLSKAMDFMTQHLQNHTQQLEILVTQRTLELKKALAQMEQDLADQSQFIAMLSHEVRSPLAVIHTAAQLLALRMKEAPSQLSIIKRILRGSTRLKHFFENCLTYDRLDSRNPITHFDNIEVRELIGWALESSTQIGSNHILNSAIQTENLTIQGDSLLLRIMLSNLLTNAIKYSPENSTVIITAKIEHNYCVVMIEDEGMGIPDNEISKIYEKYWRGRGAEGKPGAGLGLAIVYRIVNLHKGSINYTSRAPHGSCFTIHLPIQIQ